MANSTRRRNPGLPLTTFFLVVALMFAIMAISRTWAPNLGLDLRGGTMVTLTAKTAQGDTVDQASLEMARQIIQQRVDGLGVGESVVTTQGDRHIVVSMPNVQGDELLRVVGQTAHLGFRIVYQTAQATPEPEASPSPSPSPPPGAEAPDAQSGLGDKVDRLPPPPAVPRPTEPGDKKLSITELLAWQPSEQDLSEFSTWKCGDEFPQVSDQPMFACDTEKTTRYLLGPEIFTGEQVANASWGIPQGQVTAQVSLKLKEAGGEAFAKVAEKLCAANAECTPGATGQEGPSLFAVVLDTSVVEAASVKSPNLSTDISISGSFTQESAQQLANVLKYGALPLDFSEPDGQLPNVQIISPTLGGDQLRVGLIAGLIGLILVIGYCFIYYRGLAIVVVGSLVVAAVTTYATMVLLGQAVGFTLNLPAIAGAIVAIGLTGDSFVIYFERIRDEIREGRSLRTAIETGWRKARSTIVMADMVSMLSAAVLFVLAVGSVQGFAFTLGLTTIIDLAVVFFFTKPLVSLLGRTKFFGEGHKFSGLDADHMGVTRDSLLGLRPRTDRRGRTVVSHGSEA